MRDRTPSEAVMRRYVRMRKGIYYGHFDRSGNPIGSDPSLNYWSFATPPGMIQVLHQFGKQEFKYALPTKMGRSFGTTSGVKAVSYDDVKPTRAA